MKTFILLQIFILSAFFCSASTLGNATLITKDSKYTIELSSTIWKSSNDGQLITFDTFLNWETSGSFPDGTIFTSPTVPFYNDKKTGMSGVSDYVQKLDIEFGSKNQYKNYFTFQKINDKFYLIDKRGIRYQLVKGTPEKL